jgi:hypothetical protein
MLLVNLFGPPGAGKSTTRADVFRRLKTSGINCEEIIEKAKWYTWEKRTMTLACQPYLFGKQLKDTEVLDGQVDVAVTDCPLMFMEYYGRKYGDYPDAFYDAVRQIAGKYNNMNYFINRVKPYNPKGRNQTEEESNQVGVEMKAMLKDLGIFYFEVDGNEQAAQLIYDDIMKRLG